jgi:hypothetical protein
VPKRETALRVWDVVEEWSDMPAGLPARGFDFDHIGPQVAKKLAAELASFIRELEDSQTRQRARQRLGIGPWGIGPWGIAHRSISSM